MRGMLAGLAAAVLAAVFAHFVGEPQVDFAIGFEAAHEHMAHMAEEPELVSRAVQKTLGLFTAVILYGAAVGGIFSLVFAATYGRLGRFGPRSLSLLLAAAGFLAVTLAPALKYPPNPPAVGLPETIVFRTQTYFLMLMISATALVAAIQIGRRLAGRLGALNAVLAGAALYVVAIAVVEALMPTINEVPPDFPAVVLWRFRMASLGLQAVLWTAIGLGFGGLAEGLLRRRASRAA